MLELTVACVSAVGNLLLAVLVLAKNQHRLVNRYFATFAFLLAVWVVVNYVSLHPVLFSQLFWIRLVMLLATLMLFFIALLANTYPTGVSLFKRLGSWAIGPTLVIAALAMTPWLFTQLNYTEGGPQPVPGFGMVLFVPYVVALLIFIIGALVYKFRHLRGVAKEYIRYGLIGIVVTFVALVICNFVVVLVFKNSSLVALSPVFTLIFTVSFAYGIIRRRLFDIRLIVTRFVAYILLLLFSGLLYGFIAAALSFFVSGTQPDPVQITISTAVVGVLILFVQPLRQFFNHITRTVFYQDDYDTKDVLDSLATVLVHSTRTNAIAKGSMDILQRALKSDSITMLLIDGLDESEHRNISVGHGTSLHMSATPKDLARHVPEVVSVDSVEGHSDSFLRKMQESGVSVIARLETKSEIVGYCFFGYKTTGGAYSKRDIDLIRIVGDEMAVAIQNTLRFEQIQDFNMTLQERVEEATKELRTSNQQLQRLDQAKDEFVSMASHQLRTPLTSVKGYISMVLEGDVGKITKMQRQLLEEAFTSSERMVHLINDFLNVSRLQTGKFIIEARAIDLAKVVTQEVDSLQTTAGSHDLKLQCKVPSVFPILYIDESKIRQVIMNFIDNAIYYSKEDTTINVSLAIEDGDAILKVHDTGIGVPKAEQAHLFTKFFRATNARKQRPDGTGVGLFLAKKVVTAHGGSIVFESVEGEGSTFGFRLPIKKLSSPSDDADELNQ